MTSSAASNHTSERGLAVVTGASSGIGLELARQFAQHDFDLLIAAEDEGIERAAEDLRSSGVAVETAQVDLATPEGWSGCTSGSRRWDGPWRPSRSTRAWA